ncbi:MAG: hypothetical protein AAFR45_06980 [Pseudomonadota bacterium]
MVAFVDLTRSLGQKLRHDNLRLIGQTSDYNPGADGREQVIYTENRTWQGTIDFPPMFEAELALLRSVPTRLRGRAGVFRVPLLNIASPRFEGDTLAYWRSVGVPQEDIDRGHSLYADETRFDDGTGFALPDTGSERLEVAVEVGADRIQLLKHVGRNLSVGDRFSVLACLYEVEDNDDGAIRFSPPMRKAAPVGTLVRVTEPHIDLRLRSEDDWNVFINLGLYSEPLTVNVVEAFDR